MFPLIWKHPHAGFKHRLPRPLVHLAGRGERDLFCEVSGGGFESQETQKSIMKTAEMKVNW